MRTPFDFTGAPVTLRTYGFQTSEAVGATALMGGGRFFTCCRATT